MVEKDVFVIVVGCGYVLYFGVYVVVSRDEELIIR